MLGSIIKLTILKYTHKSDAGTDNDNDNDNGSGKIT